MSLIRRYPGRWINLHVHDHHSIQDALKLNPSLLKKIISEGMALTGHGTLQGIPEFADMMEGIGKTPIIGIEIYIDNILNITQSSNNNHGKKYYHLVLLVKNQKGYENLVKLASISKNMVHVMKNKYVSVLSWLDLAAHCEGLICLSACLGGELSQYLLHNQYNEAVCLTNVLKTIFKDDFYIEIQRHGLPEEDIVNPNLIKLSKETQTPLVATPDAHYGEECDKKIHDIILARKDGKTISDPTRFTYKGSDYDIYSIEKAEKKFSDIPDAIDNTVEIYEKCKNFKIQYPKDYTDYHFPEFETPNGISQFEYLKNLCYEGFKRRYQNIPEILNDPKAWERLNYELDTINKMGYNGYFLIIWDIINFSRNNTIEVGPGRGSSAGSLVAYSLEITDLCPIKYNLSFERFLNIHRKSMPDIDLDFERTRRYEVINRLKSKYDSNNDGRVAQIVTFNTRGVKLAIEDTGKVLDYSDKLIKTIKNTIPSTVGTFTFEELMKPGTAMNKLYNSNNDAKKIIDIAMKLEGTIVSTGRHAAGVVCADNPIHEYIGTQLIWDKDERQFVLVTQYTKEKIDEFGLLKIDVLGLGNLDIKKESIQLSNNRMVDKTKLLHSRFLPLNVIEVFEHVYAEGDTDGIFQVESSGMRKFIQKLFKIAISKYKNLYSKQVVGDFLFELLIAAISIYRPGPKEFIPTFLKNIENPDNITYLHPALESILKPTFGCLLYQEQVSEIVQKLAGFSPGHADILRRSMSKKKSELIENERQNFIYGARDNDGNCIAVGCLKNGINENIASQIFDWLVDFAKYAFNKSHAAVYAKLSFETAYLKHYHPIEFMTSLLNYVGTNGTSGKLPLYLKTCKNMNISVLPPNIQVSNSNFTIEDNRIRFGLKAIQKLGINSTNLIERERSEQGKYKDYKDLLERLNNINLLGKEQLEALSYSGALDCFGFTRKSLIENIQYELDCIKNNTYNGPSLFTFFNIDDPMKTTENSSKYIAIPEFDYYSKMAYEKDYIGGFISSNPLDTVRDIINSSPIDSIKEIQDYFAQESIYPERASFIGMISNIKISNSNKSKKKILRFTLTDDLSSISGIMFESDINKYGHLMQDGNIFYISGTLDEYNEKLSMKYCNFYNIYKSTDLVFNNTSRIASNAIAYVENNLVINKFKELATKSSYSDLTTLYLINMENKQKFVLPYKIDLTKPQVVDFLKNNSLHLVA